MNQEIIIELAKEFGDNLSARTYGLQLKKRASDIIESGDMVIFDFKNVRTISTGFAYELFGYLSREYKDSFNKLVKLKLYEPDKDLIRNTILKALKSIMLQ